MKNSSNNFFQNKQIIYKTMGFNKLQA